MAFVDSGSTTLSTSRMFLNKTLLHEGPSTNQEIKGTVRHVIHTKTFDTTGCVSIWIGYKNGPFTIGFNVSHDFWTQSTSLRTLKVAHTHLRIETLYRKKANEDRYLVLLSLVELKQEPNSESIPFLNNIRFKRAFWLNVEMLFDEKDRAYTLKIDFEDAPSVLRNKTISICNILDERTLLKQVVSRTVSDEFGIYIIDGILSMIFDQFLSKFQWTYSERQILYSPLLSYASLNALHSLCPISPSEYDLMSTSSWSHFWQSLQNRQHLRAHCVTTGNHHHATQCNVSGIGINIKINDPSITETTYPELYGLFRDFDIDTDSLSTIWTDITRERLKKLKNLDFHISLHCFDKYSQIDVQIRLLLDTNVGDGDIAMICTEWKSDNSDDILITPSPNTPPSDDDISEEVSRILKEKGIDEDQISDDEWHREWFHVSAQMNLHFDFEECVDAYEDLIFEVMPLTEVMDMIYGDMKHFGEPIVALQRLYEYSDVEGALDSQCSNELSLFMKSQTIEGLCEEWDKIEKQKILKMERKHQRKRLKREQNRGTCFKRQWNVQNRMKHRHHR